MAKVLPDTHYLIVSDTYQGIKVGEIIVTWLQQNHFIAEIIKITDLATNNRDQFRLAMSELINWCNDNLKGFRDSGYQVIFNLTGGFKSVQGFLQTVGMFYADECIYIFQFSSQLLQIPRLPIKLDVEDVISKKLTTFRRLDSHLMVTKEQVKEIPETLLFFLETDNQVELSEWGKLVWLQAKSTYYRQGLLTSLSDKLIYSDEFEKNVQALQRQSDRIELVNIQCDRLSQFLDSNRTNNPASLDFKLIKNTHKGSTHECDAWHDKDAQRIFGHNLNNGKYIIDRLGKALH